MHGSILNLSRVICDSPNCAEAAPEFRLPKLNQTFLAFVWGNLAMRRHFEGTRFYTVIL
jgi:hypothetical protein